MMIRARCSSSVLTVAATVLAGALAVGPPAVAQSEVQPPRKLEEEPRKDEIELSFEIEEFPDEDSFESWKLGFLSYSHRFGFGKTILRVNQAERFGRDGTQFEIDAYPKLRDGTYMYLNYGYSEDSIFPEHRWGAEIFQSLPRSFEGSLGVRRLDFASSNVTLWTGSIAKYSGNYWIALRPYYNQRDTRSSLSGEIKVRNYFRSADDYWTLAASWGHVEDESIVEPETATLDSWRVSAGLQGFVRRDVLILKSTVAYRSLEFRPGQHRESYQVRIGIEWLF